MHGRQDFFFFCRKSVNIQLGKQTQINTNISKILIFPFVDKDKNAS